MKTICITLCLFCSCLISFGQDLAGDWNGTILPNNKPVRFIFHITRDGNTYNALIDIPDKRLTGLKAAQTVVTNEELVIDLSNMGMRYQGRFSADSQQLKGILAEGANTWPLTLRRGTGESVQSVNRPQEPVKPYPYTEEEVSFSNIEAAITLAGTFTRSAGNGKVPAVILVSGSGPQDRDETFSGHKPFLVLADFLTRHGIAVLRYDDRGVGASTGKHDQATTADFASDVLSAVSYLASRKDIDISRIGIIGHSEGGIIAPMVANRSKQVAFIVTLGATGIPGSEISFMQAKATRGFPVPDESAWESAIRKAIRIASSDLDSATLKKTLILHYQTTIAPILRPYVGSDNELNSIIAGMTATRITPWARYFYNYNPADEFAKLTCPVLILNGSKDTQVQAKINQEGIRSALARGGNSNYTIKEFAGLNHLLQECATGLINEYSSITQTMAPAVLELIASWIASR
ncbi:MAG: alpha/beta hydrolase [Sediminibacterium sp.]